MHRFGRLTLASPELQLEDPDLIWESARLSEARLSSDSASLVGSVDGHAQQPF